VFSVGAALLAIAGLAFGPAFQLRRISTLDFYLLWHQRAWHFRIVLGGWASNSHYSLMGALPKLGAVGELETAAGMALVCGLLFAGTLNIKSIVLAQGTPKALGWLPRRRWRSSRILVASIRRPSRAV